MVPLAAGPGLGKARVNPGNGGHLAKGGTRQQAGHPELAVTSKGHRGSPRFVGLLQGSLASQLLGDHPGERPCPLPTFPPTQAERLLEIPSPAAAEGAPFPGTPAWPQGNVRDPEGPAGWVGLGSRARIRRPGRPGVPGPGAGFSQDAGGQAGRGLGGPGVAPAPAPAPLPRGKRRTRDELPGTCSQSACAEACGGRGGSLGVQGAGARVRR